MARRISIITVGLSPAWDITCRGQNLDWGMHECIDEQTIRPAGKALNVSRALAWMGQKSIAAGLWGRDDYKQMLSSMQALKRYIEINMTAVPGGTRRNITIVDTARGEDMHLRDRSQLASGRVLKRLRTDLGTLVKNGSICVFAGTMPEDDLLGDVIRIIEFCKSRGAKIVLDTSGSALREIVRTGSVWLIKPNVEELHELLGGKIKDGPVSLAKAGRGLLDKTEIILISRGGKGSVVVTKEGAWQVRCLGSSKTLSTVGCGDYLLAGFLKGLMDKSDVMYALRIATQAATAKAWGCPGDSLWRTESKTWPQMKRKIKVEIKRV